AYRVLDERMKIAKKPIFPILPSILTAKEEIEEFISRGRVFFSDEVVFGNALCRVYNQPAPAPESPELPKVDVAKIRSVIDNSKDGYLAPSCIRDLLDSCGIPRAGEAVVKSADKAAEAASKLGFPVVMKVVGPVHKSDVGGVVLNVRNEEQARKEFDRMIRIPQTTAILIQPMLSGVELFAGAKYEPKFGHMILCGLGGVFIEVLKDVRAGLAPLSKDEALNMIHGLKGYKIIKGVRGQKGIDEMKFADIIQRLSALVKAAPEIVELDFNPLLGKEESITVVDARVRIEKSAL
ncbi:MAG: acetate--CoA ligase family protein, partial [Bacteroidota bacterium]|nr:acetate--CoA ligase family protein [Bacteroidota bacterium]